MSKEALKLALEALEDVDGINTETECVTIDVGEAITAIREALAEQPAQQQCMEHGECFGGECIYPAQQPAQQQEPVAYVYEREIDGFGLRKDVKFLKPVEVGSDLYTSPPASKPLTDEQRNWIVATCPTPRHIIDTVEKMHGIKGST